MSTKLKISEDLSLPIDAATQTFAFIARKGAGKTYAAGKLTELLLDAGVQCVVLDTVGNWYGLRLAADGKGQGFDVPVFGGLRGDIPLEATGGELIADIVVDTGRSLILDVSQFSLSDRKKFATMFGERLWKRKKGESHPSPLMLVIEESQLIVPQDVRGDSARMVGIYEEIIRLGRNYGIGCTMISQRPQSVNKEVLNQTECLFVGQVNGSQERKALRDWVTHQGMSAGLVDELPALPVGTMYVWSPQWLRILEKVQIAKKTTYDASATPKVGEKRVQRDLKPLNLEDLKQKMAATIERAKADDPKALRQKVAELQRQLATRPDVAPKIIEKPVVSEKLVRDVERIVSRLEKDADRRIAFAGKLTEAADALRTSGEQLKSTGQTFAAALRGANAPQPIKPTLQPASRPVVRREIQQKPQVSSAAGDGELDNYETALLQKLADRSPVPTTMSHLYALAGYSTKSSMYPKKGQALIDKGVAQEVKGGLVISEVGRGLLGDYKAAPSSGEAALAHWLKKLPKYESAMLEKIAAVYPGGLSDEEIAAATGKSLTSSAFPKAIRNLVGLGFISADKPHVAAEMFFESVAAA